MAVIQTEPSKAIFVWKDFLGVIYMGNLLMKRFKIKPKNFSSRN